MDKELYGCVCDSIYCDSGDGDGIGDPSPFW